MSWHVHIVGRLLTLDGSSVLKALPDHIKGMDSLNEVLSCISQATLCPGNPDADFIELIDRSGGSFHSRKGNLVASLDASTDLLPSLTKPYPFVMKPTSLKTCRGPSGMPLLNDIVKKLEGMSPVGTSPKPLWADYLHDSDGMLTTFDQLLQKVAYTSSLHLCSAPAGYMFALLSSLSSPRCDGVLYVPRFWQRTGPFLSG